MNIILLKIENNRQDILQLVFLGEIRFRFTIGDLGPFLFFYLPSVMGLANVRRYYRLRGVSLRGQNIRREDVQMNAIKIFENNEFGKVRIIMIDGEPYFVGRDVAKILGYANPNDALAKRVDEEDKGVAKCDTLGGSQDLTVINESGLYSLILSSKLPSAKKFKHWITSEVLPSIRKTGRYEAMPTGKDLIALAVLEAQKIIERQNTEIERMKPKEEFFDSVTGSKDAIEIGQVAKILAVPGIGRNKLFEVLRKHKILMWNNIPYQKYIDNGFFRTIEQKYVTADGETKISIKTLVYQRGVDYIRGLLVE